MNPIKCRLTKVFRDENLEGGLRTDVIDGLTYCLPEEGKAFVMMSEALSPEFKNNGFRRVNTSIVDKVEKIDNRYEIKTKSGSKYIVEILENV